MVYASFFLSGAAALIFEVLWIRTVTLFCGHTTLATSAVLAAFMSGLALGSLIGGRAADRLTPRRLLLLYAAIEAGVALTGPLTGPALKAVGRGLIRAGVIELSPALQAPLFFAAAVAVLIFPTALMGASLPILTRWAGGSGGFPGADRGLSLLYGLNTLGAVAGTTAAGFYLLPEFGTARSMYCAAALNAAAAALAFAASRSRRAARPAVVREGAPEGDGTAGPVSVFPGACALFLTGAAGMVCETAWTRHLSIVIGSTTYAFTTMLATFLLGISAGSLAFDRFKGRFTPTLGGLALLMAALPAAVMAGLVLGGELPYYYARLFPFTGGAREGVLVLHFLLAALIVLPPTLLMGAVFPWTVAVLRPRRWAIGRAAGTLYSWNTLGAIAGAAAAGLWLLPGLDIEGSLEAAAWLYAGAALVPLRPAIPGPSGAGTAAAGLAVLGVLAWLRPAWETRTVTSGMFLYAPKFDWPGSYRQFQEVLSVDRVVYHRSGTNAAVTVLESPAGARYLRVNGKTDASESGDMDTQLLTGLLPLFLHRGEPRSALVIGLGSGITAGAFASSPSIDAVDVVEIEPAVAEAARLFGRSNHRALEDPRVRVRFADARQVLASAGRRYDLISSEPSNPWIAGVAYLFTREAFSSARDRLAEDGVFLQWLHSYQMSEDDFRLIVKTFLSVFPDAKLFSNGRADFYLAGSRAEWAISVPKLRRTLRENARIRDDLRGLGRGFDQPLPLLTGIFVMDGRDLEAYAAGAPVQTDDRPALEFSAARNFHLVRTYSLSDKLREASSRRLPEGLRGLEVSAEDRAALFNRTAEALLTEGRTGAAREALRRAMDFAPEAPWTWVNRAKLLQKEGDARGAYAAFRRALARDPEDPRALIGLGLLHDSIGQDEEALAVFGRAAALYPGDPMTGLGMGWTLAKLGRRAEARAALEAALDNPVPDPALRRQIKAALENLLD